MNNNDLIRKLERDVADVRAGVVAMTQQMQADAIELRRLRSFEINFDTIMANVNNEKLSDAEFREFIRRSYTEKNDDVVTIRIRPRASGELPYGNLSGAESQFIITNYGELFKAHQVNMNYYKLVCNGQSVHVYNATEVSVR